MRLLVGCPVRERSWILEHWHDAVRTASERAGLRPEFLFVVGSDAHKDISLIDNLIRGERITLEEPSRDDERAWNPDRYQHMADLRNALLSRVREREPDVWWSLDSDIITHPDSLARGIRALEQFDAVGLRCYMTRRGRECPSYGMLNNGGLLRRDQYGVFPVDVIMASKLMTPKAYGVDYVADRLLGEDIGWSQAARKAGCKLGWEGTTVSKHVMRRQDLFALDERCGY